MIILMVCFPVLMAALREFLESFGPIPSYQSLEAVVTTVRGNT